ncbi:MAG: tetratricopeptide repeat-containing sulfotransferase family protein [Planctomycetota bacterium]|jgi:tetratricopeptide (TPR) repeat protein
MTAASEREALTQAGRHYRQGSLEEAERLCRQVLKRNRRAADAYQLLGLVEFKRADWDKAAFNYRKGLAIKPREPRFHYLLAKISTARGRFREALPRFDKALALQDDFLPAIAWKAIALERLGDFEQARALVEPFVERGDEDADMAEVFVKLELQSGRLQPALAVIERQLEKPDLGALPREVLLFLKGRLLEDAGDFDASFEAYVQANAAQAATFDLDQYVAYVNRIVSFFSAERLETLPRAGNRSETPIFIAGMPRSGTTLIEQIIDAHPHAVGVGEITDLEEIVGSLEKRIGSARPYPEGAAELTPPSADRLAAAYLDRTRSLARGARRVVDKNLENYKHLGLIALLFPAARIIHATRDPLDTCVSCYVSHLMPGKHAYAADQRHLAFVYRQYERLMRHWRAVLEQPILDVSYEQLIHDQAGVSRRIIEFCGLEWDDRCLRFHESGRVATTLSYDQVRRPLYASSVARFRRFERHLGPLQELLPPPRGEGPS